MAVEGYSGGDGAAEFGVVVSSDVCLCLCCDLAGVASEMLRSWGVMKIYFEIKSLSHHLSCLVRKSVKVICSTNALKSQPCRLRWNFGQTWKAAESFGRDPGAHDFTSRVIMRSVNTALNFEYTIYDRAMNNG